MKRCTKCGKEKSLMEFSKDSSKKDGYYSSCKDCVKNLHKQNENKIKQQRQIYLKNNKENIYLKDKIKRLKYPEKSILQNIIGRCYNKKFKQFKNYGGRGIKCNINEIEIRQLMIRDGYWNLIDPNCRFIERVENVQRQDKTKQRKIILQYSLNGDFIKEWAGILIASRGLKIANSNIIQTLKGKRNQAGGFIWKYKCPDATKSFKL